MEKVVVVTVTFNSSDFLEKCIDSLLKQTYPIYKIIVIDNHSDEVYAKRNSLLKSDSVEIIYLETNTGGAGGFENGMRNALKYTPDWIWLMDDDACPNEDCLEKLLLKSNYPNIGCLCPAIYGRELCSFQTYHHKKIDWFFREKPVFPEYDQFPDCFEIDSNAFVGPLVKASIIEKIGIADGELFIYGDDTEYTFRISREYKVIVVKNAIITHRDVIQVDSEYNYKMWWKEYYAYRNRLLLISKYSHSFFQRHLSLFLKTMSIRKRIVGTIIKKKYKGFKKIRINLLKRAIKDGLKSKKGKTIDPSEYIKSIRIKVDESKQKKH